MEFATGLLTAVLSAVAFILVLGRSVAALTFTIAGATITIPGFLVVARRDLCGARERLDGFHRAAPDSKGIWGRAPLILIKEIKSKKSKVSVLPVPVVLVG